jgi:3-phenylpropionate/trans-cinnamate dioxygenase ferredoxin reductase subunit
VAGASAAEALRGAGFDGRIVLVGEETESPYQRPPLSKELLRGAVERDFVLLRSPGFYASNSIELHLGDRVVHIDPHARRVDCASGAHFEYDKLLIATGGSPRQMRVPGSDLSGVHYLRTLSQALALRKDFEHQPRVLVVGGGFIGCEVAASARQIGCEVVIAGPTLPMAQALGPELAAIYAAYHRGHGVELRSGVTVTEFRGAPALEEAVLSDGSKVSCTVAVVGIGIELSLAMLNDVDTHDGLATDEYCRTTIDNVFAAGDIARSWRPRLGRHVRLEHFDNAQLQGAAAAHSMCGKMVPYDPIPFFWSDQYEFGLQYYGNTVGWDSVVVRGRPNDGSFSAFYLQSGRIDAVCAVNRSKDMNALKRLIGRSGVAARALEDDNVPLKDLPADVTQLAGFLRGISPKKGFVSPSCP